MNVGMPPNCCHGLANIFPDFTFCFFQLSRLLNVFSDCKQTADQSDFRTAYCLLYFTILDLA